MIWRGASSKSPFSRFPSGEAEAPLKVLGTIDDFWFQWVGDVGQTGFDKSKVGSVVLRLYGPLEPWFDKTWRPGDPELVK